MEPEKRWPYFKDVYFAVFNSRDSHVRKGKDAVVAKYGREGWEKVKACKKTGLMEIFSHKPFPELRLFGETIADYADAYHAKRSLLS